MTSNPPLRSTGRRSDTRKSNKPQPCEYRTSQADTRQGPVASCNGRPAGGAPKMRMLGGEGGGGNPKKGCCFCSGQGSFFSLRCWFPYCSQVRFESGSDWNSALKSVDWFCVWNTGGRRNIHAWWLFLSALFCKISQHIVGCFEIWKNESVRSSIKVPRAVVCKLLVPASGEPRQRVAQCYHPPSLFWI